MPYLIALLKVPTKIDYNIRGGIAGWGAPFAWLKIDLAS
jgi:hypothetical protein